MRATATERRSRRSSGWIGWLILSISLVCAPVILFLQRQACGVERWPVLISPAIGYGLVMSGLMGSVIGALIASRQPGNRIGWLCGGAGAAGMVSTLANRYVWCGLYGLQPLPALPVMAWLSFITAPLVIVLVFWQIPLWFPHGRYLTPTWRRLAWIAWSALIACLAVLAVMPGPLTENGMGLSYNLENPFGIDLPGASYLRTSASRLLIIILLGFSVAANASIVLRWRQASGEERQQIKWFAFFMGVVVTLFLALEIAARLVNPGLTGSPIYVIGFYLSWVGYPLVIGISVLKYRLYDIDIMIRRTLLYGVLSVMLAAVYFGSVTVLQLFFTDFSPHRSPVVIAITTLLIAALFNPLRRRLQQIIDRRFYRSKYDAARMLDRFSASVRDDVELEHLLASLEAVVNETMQPDSVAVWLRKGHQ
jgi:hypothetical protein